MEELNKELHKASGGKASIGRKSRKVPSGIAQDIETRKHIITHNKKGK